jgi:O-antigen/teichoic acid export membrane protein
VIDKQTDETAPSNSPFNTEHPGGDLKRCSVRSGALTLGSQAVLLVMHTASVIIMARLLTPEDYGVIAMVTAITGFANLFNELGLSSATIQKSEINHRQVSALFWINVMVGASLMLVVGALSPAIAWFYKQPVLITVTLALSVTFPLTSLGAQHRALLNRQMRFGRLAVINITAMLTSILTGMMVALLGGGYWALVVSTVTMALSGTLGVWIAGVRFKPHCWGLKDSGIKDLVRFGSNVTAFDVVNYFHRNLDNVLIGRVWGAQQLGLYSRAYSLLLLPITNLRGPLNAVAFPALSRLQNNPSQFRSYYKRYCSLLAFVSMPVVSFLYITSDQIIHLLLGNQWLDAAGIFGILAVAAFIQPVASLRGLVLLAYGQGGRYFRWGLINAIATVISFACGIPWGAKGVAVAYCIVTYLVLHPSLMYVFKNTPVRVEDFYRAIIRPFVASVVMGIFGIFVIRWLKAYPDFFSLLVCALCCTPVYLGIFYLLPEGKQGLKDIWSYLQLLRSNKSTVG